MTRGGAVARFTDEIPSVESNWRAVVLFGQNVASYKFALAGALLEIAAGPDDVTLEELAIPFAQRVATHLQTHGKQGTFVRSKFLDTCRAFNRGEIDEDVLRERTVRLGFNNVIDAFHVVDEAQLATRFFTDERRAGGGIRLTDALRDVVARAADLDDEVEARWRLVETAWSLNLPRQLLTVEFEPIDGSLVVPRRRTSITGARAALNGYQKGHCFYCYDMIEIATGSERLCHVDHVFPWSRAAGGLYAGTPVDGVWNLVLACARCNGWHQKSDLPPAAVYVDRLHRRNEYLIASHHPLRPTLIEQTGGSEPERAATLRAALSEATGHGARTPWTAPEEYPAAF